MVQVATIFACKHEILIEVDVDDEVRIPETVRGVGKCPACRGETNMIAVSGLAPMAGGKDVVLDSIMMMPA